MKNLVKKVEEVAHHRNGVGGEPFYVVAFQADEDDGSVVPFIGIVFDSAYAKHVKNAKSAKPTYFNPAVAVMRRDLIGQDVIAFMANSYRGDNFAGELYDAISDWEDSGRGGLFPAESA